MSVLITGDLHLTTNPQDEYRWHLFNWLCDQSEKAKDLILLGDYTNPKDNHPAALVNRFKTCIDMCASHFDDVVLIAGNHDYVDPNCPFFAFLDAGHNGKVCFVNKPMHIDLSIGSCLFVPASADWDQLEVDNQTDDYDYDYIFTHATFDGAISETGHRLSGISPALVERIGVPVISGDIHKPQHISDLIEYVGSPYHTRFGSDYDPHILRLDDNGARTYLKYPAPMKNTYVIRSLADLDQLNITDSDHTKIRVQLDRGELTDWPKIQQEIKTRAKAQGWVLSGPELILNQEKKTSQTETVEIRSPEQLIEDYAKRHKAGEQHIEIGKALL